MNADIDKSENVFKKRFKNTVGQNMPETVKKKLEIQLDSYKMTEM